MSFPKAKIKRFNEVSVATPSPADYNIEFKSKPILGVIPLSERFTDPKSPTPSEAGSSKSTPCFRTPTFIRRKKAIGNNSAQKPTNSNLNDKELLYEKTVECNNKDAFIKELNEQIEELKNEIFKINFEKKELSTQKENFEEEFKRLEEAHLDSLNEISENYEFKISQLNETISSINDEIELLYKEIESSKILKKDIERNTKLIENLNAQLESAQNEKNEILTKHKAEIAQLKSTHNEEIENLQFEMLQTVQEIQKKLDSSEHRYQLLITEIQKKFEQDIEKLQADFCNEKEALNRQNIARIKQLEENMSEMKLLSEIQSKEKCTELENYWRSKYEKLEQESSAVLKECQSISEYALIQSELEKNEYRAKFEAKLRDYNDLEKKYDKLYVNFKKLQECYSNLQNKLYRLMKEIREKNEIKRELAKILNEKQKYETTISRSQETIEILKRRLTESDRDVEQLKLEIAENEKKTLQYEEKINDLTHELEHANVLYDETTREEIQQVQKDLLSKVEELKMKMEQTNQVNNEKLEEKQIEIDHLLKMIGEQQELNDNANKLIQVANAELEKFEEENIELKSKFVQITNENHTLQSEIQNFKQLEEHQNIDLKEKDFKIDILKNELRKLEKLDNSKKLTEIENINLILHTENLEKTQQICDLKREIEEMKTKYNKLERINQSQEKTIKEQKSLIEPFKEQLEAYELEMSNLQSAKECMENEAKDLSTKYAQMIGHQNHKQKIKYMENLKNKNEDLLKANLELESKLRAQDKKFEKIRKENAELRRTSKKSLFEDKENVGSPNRSFKCESPGPLREIN